MAEVSDVLAKWGRQGRRPVRADGDASVGGQEPGIALQRGEIGSGNEDMASHGSHSSLNSYATNGTIQPYNTSTTVAQWHEREMAGRNVDITEFRQRIEDELDSKLGDSEPNRSRTWRRGPAGFVKERTSSGWLPSGVD